MQQPFHVPHSLGFSSGTTLQAAHSPPPPLQQAISIPLPIVDDTLNEPNKTFTVDLAIPTGALLNRAASTVTITILDDDVSHSCDSAVCA